MENTNDFFLDDEETTTVESLIHEEEDTKTTEELAEKARQEAEDLLKDKPKDKVETTTTENEDEDEETPYDIFANTLIEEGIVIPLEDKEYDNSLEGIAELVKDTIELTRQQELEANPEYFNILKAAQEGISINDFISNVYEDDVDYNTVDIEDEDNQENLVRDLLTKQGVKEKMIDGIIKNSKDDGSWMETVTEAHNTLVADQQERAKAYLEGVQAERQAQVEAADAALKDLKNTIESLDEIQGFKLDKKQKDSFYNYVTKPVKDGKTKMEIDAEDETLQLKMAWMYFTNFSEVDLSKKVASKASEKFEKALKSTKDVTLNTRSKAGEVEEATDDDIDLFGL